MLKRYLKKLAKTSAFLPFVAASLGFGGARLRALRELPRNGVGMEIGVHLGDFSHLIIHIAKPRKLLLVDPWKAFEDDGYANSWYGKSTSQAAMDARFDGVRQRYSKLIQSGRVEVLRQFSIDALNGVPDESLDFVYVDGDHTYEGVKADLEAAVPKLKAGGVLCGDDYGPGGWWEGGVKQAVDEAGWRVDLALEWLIGTQFFLRKVPLARD
jgi:hypothetical protein